MKTLILLLIIKLFPFNVEARIRHFEEINRLVKQRCELLDKSCTLSYVDKLSACKNARCHEELLQMLRNESIMILGLEEACGEDQECLKEKMTKFEACKNTECRKKLATNSPETDNLPTEKENTRPGLESSPSFCITAECQTQLEKVSRLPTFKQSQPPSPVDIPAKPNNKKESTSSTPQEGIIKCDYPDGDARFFPLSTNPDYKGMKFAGELEANKTVQHSVGRTTKLDLSTGKCYIGPNSNFFSNKKSLFIIEDCINQRNISLIRLNKENLAQEFRGTILYTRAHGWLEGGTSIKLEMLNDEEALLLWSTGDGTMNPLELRIAKLSLTQNKITSEKVLLSHSGEECKDFCFHDRPRLLQKDGNTYLVATYYSQSPTNNFFILQQINAADLTVLKEKRISVENTRQLLNIGKIKDKTVLVSGNFTPQKCKPDIEYYLFFYDVEKEFLTQDLDLEKRTKIKRVTRWPIYQDFGNVIRTSAYFSKDTFVTSHNSVFTRYDDTFTPGEYFTLRPENKSEFNEPGKFWVDDIGKQGDYDGFQHPGLGVFLLKEGSLDRKIVITDPNCKQTELENGASIRGGGQLMVWHVKDNKMYYLMNCHQENDNIYTGVVEL